MIKRSEKMGSYEKLDQAIAKRPVQLRQAKEGGTKVIGLSGLGYVPEEIIYALRAIPIRW